MYRTSILIVLLGALFLFFAPSFANAITVDHPNQLVLSTSLDLELNSLPTQITGIGPVTVHGIDGTWGSGWDVVVNGKAAVTKPHPYQSTWKNPRIYVLDETTLSLPLTISGNGVVTIKSLLPVLLYTKVTYFEPTIPGAILSLVFVGIIFAFSKAKKVNRV